ncbi:hypothetical protein [Nostoc sp.]
MIKRTAYSYGEASYAQRLQELDAYSYGEASYTQRLQELDTKE